MSNWYDDAVSRLASQSDAVGRLAQDSGGFAAVLAAFESKDPNAFRWVLDRLEMLPYCELVCEWVRVKLCTLRCVEVCGPPRVEQPVPSLEEFAQAAVRLSSNERILRRAVDAVSCGDADAYHAAISEIDLEPFCHLICQWICSVGYRRVCEVVCRPGVVTVFDAAAELASTGKVLAALIANKKAMQAIVDSIAEPNCVQLQSAINAAGLVSGCETICTFFCIWRRVWVCRTLCQEPPVVLTGGYAVEEAQKFALAARQLAGQPRALADLVNAVQTRDPKVYGAVISRYRLEPYCWQVCAWVSSVTCYEFCYCVCPPPGQVIPLFTEVGCYQVGPPYPNDFNANGTTVSGALAFTGTIPLKGDIPDGTAPQALEYRFTYQDWSGISPNPNPVVNITGPMIPPTQIGELQYQYWDGLHWIPASVPFWVNNPGATVTIPQPGSPLVVSVDTDADANGWIQIPRFNDNSPGATGLFTPDAAQGLILLDTTKLTLETFDLTGATAGFAKLTAGETMPANALSKKPVFQINFECQTVSATPTLVSSNSLNAIALSNTSYSYIRHPEWPGPVGIGFGNGATVAFAGNLPAPVLPDTVTVTAGAVTGTDNGLGAITGAGIASGSINYSSGAISLTFTTAPASGVLVEATCDTITTSPLVLFEDILELDSGGGCTRLDDVIHVLYTAYHPYLGSCQVYLQGPGVAAMTTPPGGSITLPIQPNQGQVIGTGTGAVTNFTGTLTTPVLPGSVLINAGALTATDNTSGVISGGGISGTINYASGAISVTFTTAPASGVQILVDYNTNDSSGTAGTPFDMTGLPPCGYILMEVATLNLTSGANFTCGGYYGDFTDYIPFCTVSGS